MTANASMVRSARRAAKREEALRTLDNRLWLLIRKHGLQGVVESLRRVLTTQAAMNESKFGGYKWRMALSVIEIADRAIYGQHCDVPPEYERVPRPR